MSLSVPGTFPEKDGSTDKRKNQTYQHVRGKFHWNKYISLIKFQFVSEEQKIISLAF